MARVPGSLANRTPVVGPRLAPTPETPTSSARSQYNPVWRDETWPGPPPHVTLIGDFLIVAVARRLSALGVRPIFFGQRRLVGIGRGNAPRFWRQGDTFAVYYFRSKGGAASRPRPGRRWFVPVVQVLWSSPAGSGHASDLPSDPCRSGPASFGFQAGAVGPVSLPACSIYWLSFEACPPGGRGLTPAGQHAGEGGADRKAGRVHFHADPQPGSKPNLASPGGLSKAAICSCEQEVIYITRYMLDGFTA